MIIFWKFLEETKIRIASQKYETQLSDARSFDSIEQKHVENWMKKNAFADF